MLPHLPLPSPRCILAAALVTATALAAEENADTQTFNPARYALIAAEVDAATLQPGSGGPQGERKVLIKLDTATGRCWVLQLAVAGANDPTVIGASWAQISEAVRHPAARMPGEAPSPQSGNGF